MKVRSVLKITILALLMLQTVSGARGAHALSMSDKSESETIVVTATQSRTSLVNVPASVEVIDAVQLEQMNARTLAQALEYATGLVVASETGRVRAPSVRGTSSKHCLVLVDGRRLAVGYGDLVNINQIPLTVVERIEVVRGPASALYGSDALGGVVNVITRTPGTGPNFTFDTTAGLNKDGEGEYVLGSAAASGAIGPMAVLAGVEGNTKQSWNRFSSDAMDEGDDIDLGSGSARFNVDLAPGQRISGGYDFSNRSMEGERFIQQALRMRDIDAERHSGFVRYTADFSATDSFSLLLNRSEYHEDLSLIPAATSVMEGFTKNILNQIEGRYSGLFLERHLLSTGVEWREERSEGTQVASNQVENLSLYLQDEYNLLDSVQMVLGLRYDDHETFGGQWSPRVALVYHLHSDWRLRASYGEGFRAPSLTELYSTSWRQKGKLIYLPNEDLDAESSWSSELGLDGRVGSLRLGTTIFYTEVDHMIEAVFEKSVGSGKQKKDYYRYQNIGEARMQGIEFSSSLPLGAGFSFTGQATWLDCENLDTGEDIDGQPKFKADAKLAYDHIGMGVHTNVRLQYRGRTPYASGDEGDYSLVHVYLAKELGAHVECFGGVDNIFDSGEDEPTYFYAGVRARF